MFEIKTLTIILLIIFGSCVNGIENDEPWENKEPEEKVNTLAKKVGIAYTTWHRPAIWKNVWGTPELGTYNSNNRNVIRQHGEWLAYAGVDFVFIDWSNDIDYVYGVTQGRTDFDMIEKTVPIMFEEWKKIENAPKICIMLGCPGKKEAFTDGRMQRKIDQVYDMFIDNDQCKDQYYTYLGKPLIMIYVGTPSPFRDGLPHGITDDRFSYRYLTGFISEQSNLRTTNLISKYGYWSWEDRGWQTYTLMNGNPEACTISAASRAQNKDNPEASNYIAAEGRKNGETFKNRWERARRLGVSTVLVVSWNEWVTGEQPSVEVSKDIEPSEELGHQYLELLKEEIEKFKDLE